MHSKASRTGRERDASHDPCSRLSPSSPSHCSANGCGTAQPRMASCMCMASQASAAPCRSLAWLAASTYASLVCHAHVHVRVPASTHASLVCPGALRRTRAASPSCTVGVLPRPRRRVSCRSRRAPSLTIRFQTEITPRSHRVPSLTIRVLRSRALQRQRLRHGQLWWHQPQQRWLRYRPSRRACCRPHPQDRGASCQSYQRQRPS